MAAAPPAQAAAATSSGSASRPPGAPKYCIDDFAVSASALGRGNFSTLHRAKHRGTGAAYALKQIDKAFISRLVSSRRHPNAQREVLQERHVGLLLGEHPHPAIPRLHGTFQDEGRLYFLYDLCEGQELWAATRHPLTVRAATPAGAVPCSEAFAAEVARQLLAAAAHLYSLGIAHRDIKPENIMIVPLHGEGSEGGGSGRIAPWAWGGSRAAAGGGGDDGDAASPPFRVCLVDWGTAKDLLDDATNPPGDWVGTPDYMPPEAIQGSGGRGGGGGKVALAPLKPETAGTDARGDLWSIGAVVYQLLCGVPPFRSGSDYYTMERALAAGRGAGATPAAGHLPPLPPWVSAAARDFCEALLQPHPGHRLGAAADAPPPGSLRPATSLAVPRPAGGSIDWAALTGHPFLADREQQAAGKQSSAKAVASCASSLLVACQAVAALEAAGPRAATAAEVDAAATALTAAVAGEPGDSNSVALRLAFGTHTLALWRRIHVPPVLRALAAAAQAVRQLPLPSSPLRSPGLCGGDAATAPGDAFPWLPGRTGPWHKPWEVLGWGCAPDAYATPGEREAAGIEVEAPPPGSGNPLGWALLEGPAAFAPPCTLAVFAQPPAADAVAAAGAAGRTTVALAPWPQHASAGSCGDGGDSSGAARPAAGVIRLPLDTLACAGRVAAAGVDVLAATSEAQLAALEAGAAACEPSCSHAIVVLAGLPSPAAAAARLLAARALPVRAVFALEGESDSATVAAWAAPPPSTEDGQHLASGAAASLVFTAADAWQLLPA